MAGRECEATSTKARLCGSEPGWSVAPGSEPHQHWRLFLQALGGVLGSKKDDSAQPAATEQASQTTAAESLLREGGFDRLSRVGSCDEEGATQSQQHESPVARRASPLARACGEGLASCWQRGE